MNNCLKKIIDKYLKESFSLFPDKNTRERRYEAELLISKVLNIPRIDIYTNRHLKLSKDNINKIIHLLDRRKRKEPIQYILGNCGFRNIELTVGEGVFIPRTETELLVDEYLKTSSKHKEKILDLCTGSGAIGISIAKEKPDNIIIATDISYNSLLYARSNKILNSANNIYFINTELLSPFKKNSFDTIISNPPYISKKEFYNLPEEINKYEPQAALYSEDKGLKIIKQIINDACIKLKEKGNLFLEIGFQQGKTVKNLLEETGSYKDITIIKDFNNQDRIAKAQKI